MLFDRLKIQIMFLGRSLSDSMFHTREPASVNVMLHAIVCQDSLSRSVSVRTTKSCESQTGVTLSLVVSCQSGRLVEEMTDDV